ncbi:hypothetical protein Poli38472_012911 [Pythium oligandrum]|uniref:Uncharacterized protein n=1 Tax=Pythium oligandrum TaxID=41045 RepID=A0A8K1FKK4_PYTOL|nr:hypothetical protein Poli38472_012911 [Pythium oligandrum]|eukprot:TMW64289.1 hypothetical protein Poli38472_012911 [Pythium oligandrum]
MSSDPANIFGGASSASQRAMWKRQVSQQRVGGEKSDDRVSKISLPNGEQIHDISKLYEKRCIKDEQRKAHRFMRGAQTARSFNEGRHAIDPAVTLTQRLNDVPDPYYNTDSGSKKSLQKRLEESPNPCLSAFSSSKDRFASTAAYRASTFASVVKEPYADPEAIGPGTYRSKRRSMEIKRKQVPLSSYVSKSSRFEEARNNVDAVLSSSPISRTGSSRAEFRHDKMKGSLISPTPRFKSDIFPEPYVSSKQHQLQHDAPDRFYDVSASCKFTIDSSVKSSNFRCSAMQSRASRLSSEASMVHNTPNHPILSSSTKETIGPGTYDSAPRSPVRPGTQEGMNFIMMPQNADRFGLPGPNSPFIEARFRRFPAEPHPPPSPPTKQHN